ncbi:MAG: energy transducer TonB, partial [Flavobacteriaceae bacterium]|nr:energy transducer TonB [Flavobacteriaceae bacterium]
MQPKKNPKADLRKNGSLYFATGLCLVLFISWQAIEWKTYDKSMYGYEALNVDDDDDELIPLTEQIKTPPPPPPPPAPEIIEV